MKPYGEADHAPHMQAIFNRLQLFNCEWLIRPKMALSELMATMIGNLNVPAEIPELANLDTVHDMAAPMSSILRTTAKFDTKKKNSETANGKDLKQLLRFFVPKDQEVDPFLDSCVKEANAIYSLGIQVKVAKSFVE